MKFWKSKYSVCSECGVHFEPVIGLESRWENLCAAHLKAARERDEKKDAVVAWALSNMERVLEIMKKDADLQRDALNNMPPESRALQASLSIPNPRFQYWPK